MSYITRYDAIVPCWPGESMAMMSGCSGWDWCRSIVCWYKRYIADDILEGASFAAFLIDVGALGNDNKKVGVC